MTGEAQHYVLDAPIRAREVTVAALCRVTIRPMRLEKSVMAHAEKHPVAVLFDAGEGLRCVVLDGAFRDAADLEARCSGLLRRFSELAAAGNQTG